MKNDQQLESIVESSGEEVVETSEEKDQQLESKPLSERVWDSLAAEDNWYFKPRKAERWKDGLLYKFLGVHFFKKVVPTLGSYVSRLIRFRPIAHASDRKKALEEYEPATRIFESIHLGLQATLYNFNLINAISEGDIDKTISWGALSLCFNIYPIMLQRYNRARIYNALGRE